jgi:ankyrin repeat protein
MFIDLGASTTIQDQEGWTPVNLASSNGHTEVVSLLLAKEGNASLPTNDGRTPTWTAVAGGYIDVVKLLHKA